MKDFKLYQGVIKYERFRFENNKQGFKTISYQMYNKENINHSSGNDYCYKIIA